MFATATPKCKDPSRIPKVKFSQEFSQDQKTVEDSLDFMKKMVYLTTVQILHMRDLMPENAFEKRRFDDTLFYSLNVRKSALAHKVAKMIKDPIEAIDKMALKIFTIVIRSVDDLHNNESDLEIESVWHEVYSVQLAYRIGGSIIVRRDRDNTIMLKMEYSGPGSVQEQTTKLIADIAELSKVLAPLPNNVEFAFQAKFYNDPSNLDGFHPDDRLIQLPNDSLYKCLGGVVTGEAGIIVDVQSIFLNERALSRLMTPLKLNLTINARSSNCHSIASNVTDLDAYDGFSDTYMSKADEQDPSIISTKSNVTIGAHTNKSPIRSPHHSEDLDTSSGNLVEQFNTCKSSDSVTSDDSEKQNQSSEHISINESHKKKSVLTEAGIRLVRDLTPTSAHSAACSKNSINDDKSFGDEEEDEDEEESTYSSLQSNEDTLAYVDSLSLECSGSFSTELGELSIENPRRTRLDSSADFGSRHSRLTTELRQTKCRKITSSSMEVDDSAASNIPQVHTQVKKGLKPMKPQTEIRKPRERFVTRARAMIVSDINTTSNEDITLVKLEEKKFSKTIINLAEAEKVEQPRNECFNVIETDSKKIVHSPEESASATSTGSTESDETIDVPRNLPDSYQREISARDLLPLSASGRSSSIRSSLEVQANTERKIGAKPMKKSKEIPRPRERFVPRGRPIIVHSEQHENETGLPSRGNNESTRQHILIEHNVMNKEKAKEFEFSPTPPQIIHDVGQRVMEMDDRIVPRLSGSRRALDIGAAHSGPFHVLNSPALSSELQNSETATHPITLTDVEEIKSVVSPRTVHKVPQISRFSPYPSDRIMTTKRLDMKTPSKQADKLVRPRTMITKRLDKKTPKK